MSTYKILPVQDLEGYEIGSQAITAPLSLDSPAIDIMANFSRHTALMLLDDMSIEQATELLKSTHMSKALVRNSQDQFVGIVTLADLQSARVLSTANKLGVARDDLTIAHLMTPKLQCTGVQLQSVMNSTIGNILSTMQDKGTQYLLVISQVNKEIVGMISALDIAKSLHIPIQITPRASNFNDVMMAVAHP